MWGSVRVCELMPDYDDPGTVCITLLMNEVLATTDSIHLWSFWILEIRDFDTFIPW